MRREVTEKMAKYYTGSSSHSRKLVKPGRDILFCSADFSGLEDVEKRLMGFQERYEEEAKPFEWKFTKKDLRELLAKLSNTEFKLCA